MSMSLCRYVASVNKALQRLSVWFSSVVSKLAYFIINSKFERLVCRFHFALHTEVFTWILNDGRMLLYEGSLRVEFVIKKLC